MEVLTDHGRFHGHLLLRSTASGSAPMAMPRCRVGFLIHGRNAFIDYDIPRYNIEDLDLNPTVKKATILLMHHTHIKVLKDALSC